jgi:Mrp family chromosome partitioning ATPase
MLARALARNPQLRIALLDIDICGPSVPRALGVENEQVTCV